jgi:hypothetical protein
MKVSTNFLRAVLAIMGLVVLGLCIAIATVIAEAGPYRLILVGMCLGAIPFFIALYQTWKLLGYIDRKETFSYLSVSALKVINKCGIVISILYTLGMPFIVFVAEQDDAPGVVAMGLVIIFASLVIAVFATVLEKVLVNAIELKSENDLTV